MRRFVRCCSHYPFVSSFVLLGVVGVLLSGSAGAHVAVSEGSLVKYRALSAGYSSVVLADAPVAYWRLDEPSGTGGTAVDAAGSFNGTYFQDHERRASLVGDASNGSQYMNRTGSRTTSPYINMGNVLDDTNEFTLEAWISIESMAPSGVVHAIANKNSINYPRNGFVLYVTPNGVVFDIYNAGAQWTATTLANAPAGQTPFAPAPAVIYHIVSQVVYESGNTKLRIWVNGALRAERTVTGLVGAGNSSTAFAIGRWDDNGPDSVPQTYDGTVDEVAMYSGALSADRIRAHYTDGAGSYQPPEQTSGVDCDPLGGGSLGKAPCGTVSDPVNTLTGAFTHAETDLTLPSTGVPFELTRTYSSAEALSGRLGPGWTDTYQASLVVQPSGDVVAKGDEGQRLTFAALGGGAFDGGPGAQSTLVSIAGGYRLTTFEQLVYEFDTAGKLLSKKDRNGQGVTLAYDGSGRLATVTDSASNVATFAYNASNLVSGISLSDGRSVGYGYTAGLLTSFTDVRGKTWQYTYDGAGRLATIVDPLAHTQVSNVYDAASGRVVSQADALNKTTTFAWDAGTQTATVTDPNNHVWKDVYVNNVLVKRIDGTNGTTEFGFDPELNGTSVKGPSNETTTMTYDAAGNILTATAPASLGSAQKAFVYNGMNDPTQVTDARATVTAYGYDTAGNQTSVTQAGVTVATMTYDTAGRVLTSTIGNGKTTTYTYDAAGNTLSETDPLGNKTTFTYDAAGRMLTRVDPKGNVTGCSCAAQFTTSFTYNAAGQVLTETDQLGNTTTSTYDDAGNLLTKTDGNGKVTSYVYDNANRVVSVTAADGGVSLTSYDDAGNKLTETDPLGHVTTHTYDSANRLVSTTTASGAKTTMFYDANGNLVKQVEPRGNVSGANPDDFATTFTYDAAGRVLTETDPLGHVTTHVYDAVGNEIQVTDPNNKTTVSVYDARNRLSTVTAPDGGVTTYTYDAEGNKLTVKDARNNITTSTYDDANRLASVTKPSGGKTTYAYDANGNQTSMVEARGNVSGCACAAQYTWTTAFDRANRKLSETSPLGHVTSYTYDGVGNQLTLTDANNHQTVRTYDAVNRVKTVTAPDLGVTTNTYDLAGNLVSRKDARNNTTTYAYDLDNQRTTVTNPLGKIWTTAYDAAGNVASTTDANGNATVTAGDGTTTSTYDRAGRLTAVDYSDMTPDVAYTYDNAGNRLTMVDGSGTQTRTYDSVNRLLSVTRGTDTFSYVYDLAGNLTKRTYPGGAVTDYTFDVDNRMATAVNAALTTTYGYDVAGNLVSTTLPSANGHVETRVYDRSGRVTEVKNQKGTTVLSKFALTLDPVGNPTTSVRTGGVSQTQVHTYDVNDRILSTCFQAAACPVGSAALVTWTYDKVGNRLTEKRSSTTVTSTFNTADQLTAAGSTNYTYDSNGNQLTAGTRTFTYDLANRLKTTVSGSTTTTYTYDGDGVRQQTSTGTAASAKTNFVWDINQGLPQVALERNGSNNLQRQYIYGLKRIRQTVGTASYYHTDQLGSVTNTTSASGASQRTWSYEPYGVIRTSTGSSPTNFVNFTGDYLDPTGLYHLRARQYDPVSGRFTRTDAWEAGSGDLGLSADAYVADRPTVLIDPSGLCAQSSGGAADTALDLAASPDYQATRGLAGRNPSSGFPSCQAHGWVNSYGTKLVTQVARTPDGPAVPWGLVLHAVRGVQYAAVVVPFILVNGNPTRPPTPKINLVGYTYHGFIRKYQVISSAGWRTKYLRVGDSITFEFLGTGARGRDDIGPVTCRVMY